MIPLIAAFVALVGVTGETSNIDALMDNGHWRRARVLADATYKANPNDARANYWMARVAQRYGHLGDAVKYAEAAVKLDPRASAHHRVLGEILGDQAQQGSVFKQMGSARRIHAEWETALSLDPKNRENILDLIQFLAFAPGIMGGDKKRAAELANNQVKTDPANGYLSLAELAAANKEFDKREELYQKAAQADPKNYEAQFAAAEYYESRARLSPADVCAGHAKAR
jgi:tetratricopeptide (TPR) repeat protein